MVAVVLGRVSIGAGEAGSRQPELAGRLVAWAVFVGALAALGYSAQLLGGDTPDDLLYRWSTAIGGLVQYAIMLFVAWLIARGLGRDLLGLRAPASWRRAAALIGAGLVAIWIVGAVLNLFLKAGEEQGLVPDGWDGSRAAPFVANLAVVAIAAPIVEEFVFRGLGYGLVSAFTAPWPAIVITGVAFGLAHGLVVALPVLALFGVLLGWLRSQTGSIYPSLLVHSVFNTVALLAAVLL